MVLVVGAAVDSSVRLSATSGGGAHSSDAFGWCSSSSRRPLLMTESASSLGALLAPTPPLLRRILLRSHGDAPAMLVSSGMERPGPVGGVACVAQYVCTWAADACHTCKAMRLFIFVDDIRERMHALTIKV
ncbi:hypothetical protein MRX96_045615 [Rhipicephalus microplus]